MPRISVLLPVYNTRATHLRHAINSILRQTYRDFELLIVNDASTEAHVDAVVRSYDDPRIVYVRNEVNQGISAVRNQLLGMAQGEYLAVMDHDDIAIKTRFEKQIAFMDAHPDVGICGGAQKRFGNWLKRKTIRYPENDAAIRVGLFFKSVMLHPSVMIRADVLRQHNLQYDTRFVSANDRMLFVQISDVSQLHNLPDIVHLYRMHTHNASKTHRQKIESQQAVLRDYLLQRLGVHLDARELAIFNHVLMKGRVRIRDTQTLIALEAVIHKLIVANQKSGLYPQDAFEKECAAYFLKRAANAVLHGRLNVYDMVSKTRLPVAKPLPWIIRLSRLLS